MEYIDSCSKDSYISTKDLFCNYIDPDEKTTKNGEAILIQKESQKGTIPINYGPITWLSMSRRSYLNFKSKEQKRFSK